ncbi:hypothetical protein ACFQ7B_43710, partial [Streptomyces erythrochromogenes]
MKDFDLTETAVRLWLAQADESHQHKDLERDERAELAELRRENRRLREDIEILKRATVGSIRQLIIFRSWRLIIGFFL